MLESPSNLHTKFAHYSHDKQKEFSFSLFFCFPVKKKNIENWCLSCHMMWEVCSAGLISSFLNVRLETKIIWWLLVFRDESRIAHQSTGEAWHFFLLLLFLFLFFINELSYLFFGAINELSCGYILRAKKKIYIYIYIIIFFIWVMINVWNWK